MSAAAGAGPGPGSGPLEDTEVSWELGGLALARGLVDRSTLRRADAAWVAAARTSAAAG